MEILIYKDDYRKDFVGKSVDTLDAAISFLKKKIKRKNCTAFSYAWDDNGDCGNSTDDEARVVYDADKMVEMVTDRVNEFGYCVFGCSLGEIVIKDYSNICFVEKNAAHMNGLLNHLKNQGN